MANQPGHNTDKIGAFVGWILVSQGVSRGATLLIIGPLVVVFGFASYDALTAGNGPRSPGIGSTFQGRAMPVAAFWIDPTGGVGKPKPIEYSDLGVNDQLGSVPAFLLLGTKDGTIVLYDKRLGAVRLPRDKVLLVSSSTQ